MSVRLMCAPLWVRWAVTSLLFAAGLAVAGIVASPDDFDWSRWLAAAAICCVAFGGLVAYGQRRYAGRCAEALAGLDGSQRRAAMTAVSRGPAPRDPAVHAATVRLGAVLVGAQRVVTNRLKLYAFLAVLWGLLAIASFATGNVRIGVLYTVIGLLSALAIPLQRRNIRRLQLRMAMMSEESAS